MFQPMFCNLYRRKKSPRLFQNRLSSKMGNLRYSAVARTLLKFNCYKQILTCFLYWWQKRKWVPKAAYFQDSHPTKNVEAGLNELPHAQPADVNPWGRIGVCQKCRATTLQRNTSDILVLLASYQKARGKPNNEPNLAIQILGLNSDQYDWLFVSILS